MTNENEKIAVMTTDLKDAQAKLFQAIHEAQKLLDVAVAGVNESLARTHKNMVAIADQAEDELGANPDHAQRRRYDDLRMAANMFEERVAIELLASEHLGGNLDNLEYAIGELVFLTATKQPTGDGPNVTA
jgi:hypothetical protein